MRQHDRQRAHPGRVQRRPRRPRPVRAQHLSLVLLPPLPRHTARRTRGRARIRSTCCATSDADILARWDTQWAVKEVYSAGEYRSEFVDQGGVPVSSLPPGVPTTTSFNIYPPGTNEHRRRFVTPYGTLTQVWSFTAESAADFEAKYWWTDWDEYEAMRFMLEARDYTFDAELFRQWVTAGGRRWRGHVPHHAVAVEDAALAGRPAERDLLHHGSPGGNQGAGQDPRGEGAGAARTGGRSARDRDLLLRATTSTACSIRRASTATTATASSRGPRRSSIATGSVSSCTPAAATTSCCRWSGASGVDCLEGITPPPLGDVRLGDARRLAGKAGFHGQRRDGLAAPGDCGKTPRPRCTRTRASFLPAWAICGTSSSRRAA